MEEIVKKKRGRPKKNSAPQLPEEVVKIIEDVKAKEEQEYHEIVVQEKLKRKGEWDFKIDDPIPFFDANMSYELTGYKPITEEEGLDFDPDWFTETRDTYNRTGHYTQYPRNSKLWRDFWQEQYVRCRNGMTVNGYTITGDHYFFLNFYRLKDSRVEKAGTAREDIFPRFRSAQYEFFHYYELCKLLRKNVCMMKSRAIGFSEIVASLCANEYSCFAKSITMITAFDSNKLNKTLEKVWGALNFLNDHTDGGFFKLRQVSDSALLKRASHYKYVNGQKVEDGWMAQIEGIVADKPSKVRGDRAELVVFEEAGSNPVLRTSYVQGEALVHVGGNKIGILLAGGTGGDKGAALAGLQDMYNNPDTYDVLKFRHSYTQSGETILSGFFVPSFKGLDKEEYIDHRGVCYTEKCKEFYMEERAKKANSPKALVEYCAEYCFNAEEAFALEGENKFNKVLLSEQLTRIRVLKQCPKIDKGQFQFLFKTNTAHTRDNLTGVKWVSNPNGKVKILEHPLWTLDEILDAEGNPMNRPNGPMRDMYVAGVDGIDIGGSQTSEYTKDPSDFCFIVKKRVYGNQAPQYVAIYKDRPENLREAYKNAIALAMYYNAKINIEATRMSFITWARENKYLNYFMKRPSATFPDISKRNTKQYGSPATKAVIEHQTDLIADYVEDYCEEIWFDEILDELIRYNDEEKRKFDIVAALGMCELADEELQGSVPKAIKEEVQQQQDIGYYYDENGYKRFGIIPNKPMQFPSGTSFNTDSGYFMRSSDPRYYGRT